MARQHGHKPYTVKPVSYNIPEAPKKIIGYETSSHKNRAVDTEFHEAFISLGLNDRTKRLSNRNLNLQMLSEAKYLFAKGSSHLSKALHGFATILDMLF